MPCAPKSARTTKSAPVAPCAGCTGAGCARLDLDQGSAPFTDLGIGKTNAPTEGDSQTGSSHVE